MKKTDVVVIGAGPVGLFASFYCGMRSLSSVLIDKMEIPGGRLSALYPEKYIYDVAGFPKVKAQELIDNLVEQLDRFSETTEMMLGQNVESLEKKDDVFVIKTDQAEIEAKAVIIAAGGGAFSPRKLGLDGEEQFKNIHYFVNDMEKFRNRRVAIFGGGDSAVDWALMLTEIASEVHIIHRRPEFRAHGHSVEMLEESTVNIHTPFTPKALVGEGDTLQKLVITDKKMDKEIEIDDCIVNYGFISNLGSLNEWGLNIEKNKILVNSCQETNIKGIFAIGDICDYPGKAEIIVNGFGEGPIAVNEAFKHINPDAVIGAMHSSSMIKE
ncbi:MAG: NAD(P)/FAD-dependent oxidoreductase [Mycoplasmatales bacterium]